MALLLMPRREQETRHSTVLLHVVESGANANVANQDRATPLHLAAFNRDTNAARILMAHGADANARDMNGQSPIDVTRLSKSDDEPCEELLAILNTATEEPKPAPKDRTLRYRSNRRKPRSR